MKNPRHFTHRICKLFDGDIWWIWDRSVPGSRPQHATPRLVARAHEVGPIVWNEWLTELHGRPAHFLWCGEEDPPEWREAYRIYQQVVREQ